MSETNGESRRCPLWMKVALVLSLVANMAVAGVYLGHMSKETERKRGAERQIRWIVKFVPESRRADAEKLFDAKREQIRDLYRDSAKFLEEIVQAIRAEPFSHETVTAAMRARRENSEARRLLVEEATVELLSTLTPQERAHFADEMEQGLQRWRERRAAK